ncbi:MAG: hypothetical protein IT183_05040 [Acidobacteria bacterium]|nr:hypothetical protein [Acidobacteriota bacterium]
MVEILERVARVEGRVEGHAQVLTDVAGAVRHLEARLEHLEARMDQRFSAVDVRLTALDQRIGTVETRLEQKLDSHFRWLVGIQFAMFVTLVASLVAIAG